MMNANIEIASQLGKASVNVTLTNESCIDSIAINMLRNDCPPFILSSNLSEMNGQTVLRFDAENYTSLEYFSAQLSRQEFLKLCDNLLKPISECAQWLLNGGALCFTPKYIFVDKYTFNVKYIYVPVLGADNSEADIKALIMKALQNCNPQNSSDLQMELYRLFAQPACSLADLNEVITRHINMNGSTPKQEAASYIPQANFAPHNVQTPVAKEDKNVSAVSQVASKVQQGLNQIETLATPKPQNEPKAPAALKNLTPEELLEYEIMQGLSAEKPGKAPKKEKPTKEKKPVKEKKPLFSFGKKEVAQKKNDEIKEILLGAPENYSAPARVQPAIIQPAYIAQQLDESTEIAVNNGDNSGVFLSVASYNCPYNIPPRIEIVFNNGAMTIGRFDAAKNVKKTDFAFDSTIKPISRIHARLEFSNNQYYLIDLGSANGT
ncbi:MAG: DUF6382 domain-containing protein, partial [Christensenella sp.]